MSWSPIGTACDPCSLHLALVRPLGLVHITGVPCGTREPPVLNSSTKDVAAGAASYARYCLVCHGMEVVSGGATRDLRRSTLLGDQAAWSEMLLGDGGRAVSMPDFAEHVTPDEAERIRAYVISRAHRLYADEPHAN